MSLRVRLLLAVGVVALMALVAADLATYSALRSFLYQRVDQTLEAADFAVVVRGARVEGVYEEVRDQNGNVVSQVGGSRFGDPVAPRLPNNLTDIRFSNEAGPTPARALFTVGSQQTGGPRFRVIVTPLPGGGQLIMATPLNEVTTTLHRLILIELVVTLLALAAAAGVGWWVVRVGLRPLADVESTAAAIADGQLDRRVPGDSANTEVGRLARALNVMLGRIQDAFSARDATEARLRRFVGDASHELRTPLAAVSAYAELFERGARDNPDDLARAMSGIRSETGRMGGLVEDLLLLARLDEGRPLERKPVELVELAGEAVDVARATGPAWPVELEAAEPVEIVGDRARLRQVLDNLLSNVRAHTPPGTPATVRVSHEGDGFAALEVHDDGPGLTPQQAGRAFERFYRADPSRSRLHGGSGLGLSIVAAIVDAHGGDVELISNQGGGVTFTARLPLAGPPAETDGQPGDRPQVAGGDPAEGDGGTGGAGG